MKTMPYGEFLEGYLTKPENVAAYLNAALMDDDPRVFLLALRNVARVYGGGMGAVAQKAKLGRESLYKALSGKRYPRIDSLNSLLRALGFAIEIKPKKPKPARKRKTAA
ncbi:MAG: putative addiction module antidote protein [Nitrospinae bacterium]|nr:putative addiction module antidote protein [Nitrospinota bacterium]